MDRDRWASEIAKAYDGLPVKQGYKLVYSPWSTIKTSKAAFVSLNPGGRMPDHAELCELSEERGNAYEVERHITKSPITHQFLEFCKLIGVEPIDVLTGVICPFRTDRWADAPIEVRAVGLKLGEEFWREALAVNQPGLIVSVAPQATKILSRILAVELVDRCASGWGKTTISIFQNATGQRLVQLPHLSTFKLFSRPECRPALEMALKVGDC